MPVTKDSEQVGILIREFFGKGNDISWSEISGSRDAMSECARMWLSYFQKRGTMLVLPRRTDGELFWYVAALTDHGSETVKELLHSFVGPPYTSFDGEPIVPSTHDPCENTLIRLCGTHSVFFRLGVLKGEFEAACIHALNLMLSLCTSMEQRPVKTRWVTGYLLRDFRMALAAGNYAEASAAILHLRNSHALDTLNLNFLEVQMLSELGRWHDITRLPLLEDIIASRHPRSVSRVLIQAIYNTYLLEYELADDVDGACSRFSGFVRPQYASLYRSRRGLSEPEVLKSFILHAVTIIPQDTELRDEVLAIATVNEHDSEYIRKICLRFTMESSPKAHHKSGIEGLRELAEQGRWDKVLATASGLPACPQSVQYMLQSAYELDTLQSKLLAGSRFSELAEPDRLRLLQSRQVAYLWTKINEVSYHTADESAVSSVQPADLFEWLTLVSHKTHTLQKLVSFVQTGTDEWSVDAFLDVPDVVSSFENLFDTITKDDFGRDVAFIAVPYMFSFLQRDDRYPNPVIKAIYLRILMEICYTDNTSNESTLAVVGELARAGLEIGLDDSEYQEMLDDIALLWDNSRSVSNVEAMLDIIDLLAYYPCPSNSMEMRASLATKVVSSAIAWLKQGRVHGSLLHLSRLLSEELQLGHLISESDLPSNGAQIDGTRDTTPDPLASMQCSLAIHTLVESAGHRIRSVLKERSPDCGVEINFDRVGTNRLKHLAQNADLFIITTSSATHAATDFIQKWRKGKPILRPTGRGTSSMLSVLVNHMEAQLTHSTQPS